MSLSKSALSIPPLSKNYFYWIDVHGHLFLESTSIKNFVTSFKDPPFLDFFYSRLQRNPNHQMNSKSNISFRYPWKSSCGKENNWIQSENVPIVFKDLKIHEGIPYLIWGGTLKLPFHPEYIGVGKGSGHLYHSFPKSKTNGLPIWGLLKSSLVQNDFSDCFLSERMVFSWEGIHFPIKEIENPYELG